MEKSSYYEKDTILCEGFRKGLLKCVETFIKLLSLSNLAASLPAVEMDRLRPLHDRLVREIKEIMERTVNELFTGSDIVHRLNDLYRLSNEREICADDAWRPSGDPEKDIEGHLRPLRQEHQDKLSGILEEARTKTEQKWAEVHRLEKQIQAKQAVIKDEISKLKKEIEDL